MSPGEGGPNCCHSAQPLADRSIHALQSDPQPIWLASQKAQHAAAREWLIFVTAATYRKYQICHLNTFCTCLDVWKLYCSKHPWKISNKFVFCPNPLLASKSLRSICSSTLLGRSSNLFTHCMSSLFKQTFIRMNRNIGTLEIK